MWSRIVMMSNGFIWLRKGTSGEQHIKANKNVKISL
jgi:hypothetical protein